MVYPLNRRGRNPARYAGVTILDGRRPKSGKPRVLMYFFPMDSSKRVGEFLPFAQKHGCMVKVLSGQQSEYKDVEHCLSIDLKNVPQHIAVLVLMPSTAMPSKDVIDYTISVAEAGTKSWGWFQIQPNANYSWFKAILLNIGARIFQHRTPEHGLFMHRDLLSGVGVVERDYGKYVARPYADRLYAFLDASLDTPPLRHRKLSSPR